ncbi:MAG: radical SAM protein [Chloroflexi bacterium]|nr:radical SAM protein [Chloroflexota bacterium]MCL5076418.1 radical SAM protein [Chloroflexota bacterium]
MKVALLEVESARPERMNKDLAGGFGTASNYGVSFAAKLLMFAKRRTFHLPIISLGYLAAIFRDAGWEVEVVRNRVPQADLVIIPSSIVDYRTERAMAAKIKKLTQAKVGFIGPFSSLKPELFLDYADFVIKGEPEAAARRISGGWLPNGEVVSEQIEDLDSLPFPDWSVFPVQEYTYAQVNQRPFLPILSSRGCSFSCRYYCPYPLYEGTRWRHRSVDNVVKEVKYLVEKYKIKGLLFRDPVFTLDKERAQAIARGIKEAAAIVWACETHLNLLDERMIDNLYKSGLRAINVGIEAADDEVLREAKRKPIGHDHQERIIRYCERKGIRIGAFYILGLPDQTRESIERTIAYAIRLNTSFAQFTVCTPYPGTQFYDDVKERIVDEDWEQFNAYTLVFRHWHLSKQEILNLKEKAFLRYYYRPRWIAKFLKELAYDFCNRRHWIRRTSSD